MGSQQSAPRGPRPAGPVRFGPDFRIALALLVANAAFILLFLHYEALDSVSKGWTRRIAWGIVLVAAAGLFLRGPVGRFLTNLQLTLFSMVVLFGVLQAAFYFFPQYWPQNIQGMMVTEDPEKLRRRIIEYLPHSPWAKPLPNISFTIPGFYSPSSDFDYEFITDRRGFKNLRTLDSRDQYDIVAVGDSFTEGMGVHARDTFVSRLNSMGVSAYSIGIQGYAPTQMAGAFRHFGMTLRPKVVVVGYLGNIYTRERFFLANTRSFKDAATPPEAIGRLIERDRLSGPTVYFETKEGYRFPTAVKKQYRFVPTAIVALGAQYRTFLRTFNISAGIPDAKNDIRFGLPKELKKDAQIKIPQLTIYRHEVLWSVDQRIDINELNVDPAWASTLASLRQIIGDAQSVNAKVVLLMLHNRGGIYYEGGTGNPLPPDYGERSQALLLRQFAEREGADFVDSLEVFLNQVRQLKETSPFSDLPYLKIDGHPSAKGHELIAGLLRQHVESKGYLRVK